MGMDERCEAGDKSWDVEWVEWDDEVCAKDIRMGIRLNKNETRKIGCEEAVAHGNLYGHSMTAGSSIPKLT